jgi:hypothetical protein
MASANVSACVVISKDGPYLVTGSPPLSRQTIITDSDGGSERWQEGETFAVQRNYGSSVRREFQALFCEKPEVQSLRLTLPNRSARRRASDAGKAS